jgi:hypothetical protein
VLNVLWIYYCVYTYTDPELLQLSPIWLSIASSSSVLPMSHQNQEYTETFFNLLTLNDPYRGRTTPLTSKVALYIFIQQI